MKIIMASNGQKSIKISKTEWKQIGKMAGWMKNAGFNTDTIEELEIDLKEYQKELKGLQLRFKNGEISEHTYNKLRNQLNEYIIDTKIEIQQEKSSAAISNDSLKPNQIRTIDPDKSIDKQYHRHGPSMDIGNMSKQNFGGNNDYGSASTAY